SGRSPSKMNTKLRRALAGRGSDAVDMAAASDEITSPLMKFTNILLSVILLTANPPSYINLKPPKTSSCHRLAHSPDRLVGLPGIGSHPMPIPQGSYSIMYHYVKAK